MSTTPTYVERDVAESNVAESNVAERDVAERDVGQRPEQPIITGSSYHCDCGHLLRVFGGGRHRVYFELTDASLTGPVMDRVCPRCGHGLPGKNS